MVERAATRSPTAGTVRDDRVLSIGNAGINPYIMLKGTSRTAS